MLSPDLAAEFSHPYVKRIVDACQDENFIIVYHNCGNTAILTIDSILSVGARVYHFGNAIDMAEMMPHIPPEVVAMGNVDPAGQFRNGTPESIRQELQIMCVLFTEDIGGVLMLEFTPEGNLEFKVEADEGDYLFDEIGSELKIRQYQREKRELLESLEMFYKVFFLGMDREALLAAAAEQEEEDGE